LQSYFVQFFISFIVYLMKLNPRTVVFSCDVGSNGSMWFLVYVCRSHTIANDRLELLANLDKLAVLG
jgi:hypothetical protein